MRLYSLSNTSKVGKNRLQAKPPKQAKGIGSPITDHCYCVDSKKGAALMKLNDIQIEVLNDNLTKAHQLAELMYQASIDPNNQRIPMTDWQGQLKRLSIRLNHMRGTYNCC